MKARLSVLALITLLGLGVFAAWILADRSKFEVLTLRRDVFDRVLSRGELRVGYLVLPPYLRKDAATGALSGIFYDLTEEIGRRLGFKVSWVEEVSLATLPAGLETGRYDYIAFPLWRSAARAKIVGFSVPLYYTPVGIYVREADHRFDSRRDAINSPDVRIAGIDGELAFEIARSDFPEAREVALPQMSDYSQMLLEVASDKADVTFFNRVLGDRFVARNSGMLRDISGGSPIRVFAEALVLPRDDLRFKAMIDTVLMEMIDNGVIDRFFSKSQENPKEYYRPALPYRRPGTDPAGL
jgi:ABC-type amino acid transport substrate-binding protein